jgi:hypothetical protein
MMRYEYVLQAIEVFNGYRRFNGAVLINSCSKVLVLFIFAGIKHCGSQETEKG